MRLNRFIADAGIASRRKADELIEQGEVTVNGKPAVIGMEVDPAKDHVKVRGKLIHKEEEKVHILLYKPVGYLSSVSDPEGRPLITSLVSEYARLRLYPIGRLDYTSEGLILLTNDGDFAARVGHPSTGPEKTYLAKVRGVPDDKTLEKLRSGITIDDHKTRPAKIFLLRGKVNAWLEVTIKEGRNQQIRKMFQVVGHPVVKLRRIRIGALNPKGLKPGQYRLLTQLEVVTLMRSESVPHIPRRSKPRGKQAPRGKDAPRRREK